MWIDEDYDYTLVEKLKHLYWKTVPYNWRPAQIIYRLKCFLWYRHTVVHPKTLPFYTWCDRCTLLPHTMFQILADFIEQECSPGHIDWESSGHEIEVDGVIKNVRKEMQDLYDWWKKCNQNDADFDIVDYTLREKYESNFKRINEISISGFRKIKNSNYSVFYTEFPNNDEEEHNKLVRENINIRIEDSKLLIKNMQRLCALQPYLWT